MKNKLGLSSGFFQEPSLENWKRALEAGFTEVELGMSAEEDVSAILQKASAQLSFFRSAGLNVSSVHLPFSQAYDPSLLDGAARYRALECFQELISWTGDQGIDIAVIHASYEPIDDAERAARLETAVASIAQLGEWARGRRVRLAVENLPRTCLGNTAADMLALSGRGGHAFICFDVNHLLIETHAEFYEQIAPYMITTHLSDYDRINERHWLPGEGTIDWAELWQLFQASDYQGRLIFELNETSAPSLDRPYSPEELLAAFRREAGIA
ncbi:MAG: sugar phosphate isomerase/epimerase family protein [Bacillota bacterium]|nr:sugar phosphate isomerase/epimerase family protein [Bacillota bacterium]